MIRHHYLHCEVLKKLLLHPPIFNILWLSDLKVTSCKDIQIRIHSKFA